MSDELTRPLDTDLALRAESDGRTIDLRVMPWGIVADTPEGRETFVRGAFADLDASRVTIESQRHGGELVGRGQTIEERDDGAYLTARISRTRAGDDLLTLIGDGVVTEASAVFRPVRHMRRRDGVIERQRVELRRVAILERGAYPGAGVMAVRGEVTDMDGTATAEVIETPPAAPAYDPSPIIERMERVERAYATLAAMSGGSVPEPLAYRAESLGELLLRSWDDRELSRALADQITTDNPGLIPKAMIDTVVGILNRGRRTIDAFGPRQLPPKGMTATWPRLTSPMTGLIAAQSAEKAAIVSAKVSFGEGTSPIVTYAGGSDVSYQLIRRSDPPYLEQYARVMLAAWGNVTNAALSAAVFAAAGSGAVWAAGTDTDGSKFIAALVDASLDVEAATGQPAEFVILASDLFAKVAGFYAPKSINPVSAGGTALASTLSISVSGLPVIHEPALAPSTGYASNSLAAAWLEDPLGAPAQINVADAEKIGENVAYWSLGAAAIYIPGGISKFTATI